MEHKEHLGPVRSFINFQVSCLASQAFLHPVDSSEAPHSGKTDRESEDPAASLSEDRGGLKKGNKYRTYSYEFKKKAVSDVVKAFQNSGQSLSKIIRIKAKKLGVHCKNLQRWYRRIQVNKKEGGRKAAFPEMEEILASFIRQNPNTKRRVIIKKAKQIMEDLGMDSEKQFNYSKGWYERFRERYFKKKEPEEFEHSEADPIFEPKIEEDLAKKIPIILIKKEDSTPLPVLDNRFQQNEC